MISLALSMEFIPGLEFQRAQKCCKYAFETILTVSFKRVLCSQSRPFVLWRRGSHKRATYCYTIACNVFTLQLWPSKTDLAVGYFGYLLLFSSCWIHQKHASRYVISEWWICNNPKHISGNIFTFHVVQLTFHKNNLNHYILIYNIRFQSS